MTRGSDEAFEAKLDGAARQAERLLDVFGSDLKVLRAWDYLKRTGGSTQLRERWAHFRSEAAELSSIANGFADVLDESAYSSQPVDVATAWNFRPVGLSGIDNYFEAQIEKAANAAVDAENFLQAEGFIFDRTTRKLKLLNSRKEGLRRLVERYIDRRRVDGLLPSNDDIVSEEFRREIAGDFAFFFEDAELFETGSKGILAQTLWNILNPKQNL